MGTTEEVKLRILAFLLKAKEATAKQLEEKADCANKTFLKARQQLEKESLIEKSYRKREHGGIKALYRIPQEKLRTVKAMLEREAFFKNVKQKAESISNPDAFKFLNAQLLEYESRIEMAVCQEWLNRMTLEIQKFIHAAGNVFFGNIEKEEEILALKKWGEFLKQRYADALAVFKTVCDNLKFHPVFEISINGNQKIIIDIDAKNLDHYESILNLLEGELTGLNLFINLKLKGENAVKFFKESLSQDRSKGRFPFLQLDAYLKDIKETVKYVETGELQKAKLLELLELSGEYIKIFHFSHEGFMRALTFSS